jgi:predicted methyltransferase
MFYDPRKNDHGLPRDPYKAIVVPRPIGWITSMSAKGEINLAPYSLGRGRSGDSGQESEAGDGHLSDRLRRITKNMGRFQMTIRSRLRGAILPAFAIVAAAVGAVAVAAAQGAPDYAAIVAAPDRSETDRVIDKRRNPAQLLAFVGARPGMKVLDMGAGGGYSTELLARSVAPNGVVYAHNMPNLFPKAKANFDARMKAPAMKSVVSVMRPFDDPTPPEVRDLDIVTFFFFYHDVTYMEVNRAAMNARLFAALKPGGMLVIADHSARAGEGTSVGKTLHRIEEAALRGEVEAAGFRLVASADFLRAPGDPRDHPSTRPKGPVDRFVLKFQKPK